MQMVTYCLPVMVLLWVQYDWVGLFTSVIKSLFQSGEVYSSQFICFFSLTSGPLLLHREGPAATRAAPTRLGARAWAWVESTRFRPWSRARCRGRAGPAEPSAPVSRWRRRCRRWRCKRISWTCVHLVAAPVSHAAPRCCFKKIKNKINANKYICKIFKS